MNARRTTTLVAALVFLPGLLATHAQEQSPYMGGEVTLETAPNGALVNAEVLEVNSKILYLEPTTEKVADGVWCIGGHSLANTTKPPPRRIRHRFLAFSRNPNCSEGTTDDFTGQAIPYTCNRRTSRDDNGVSR
jgi:hypothetical protein